MFIVTEALASMEHQLMQEDYVTFIVSNPIGYLSEQKYPSKSYHGVENANSCLSLRLVYKAIYGTISIGTLIILYIITYKLVYHLNRTSRIGSKTTKLQQTV